MSPARFAPAEDDVLVAEVDVDVDRWYPDAIITSLIPYGLGTVPGFSGDEGDDVKRADWFGWRDDVRELRDRIWRRAARDPLFAARERTVAFHDVNYFKAIYGWIDEPRPRKNEGISKPLIPFAYQVHLTDAKFALVAEADERDMWQPKSRGLGVSWNNQNDETWAWLATPQRWILSSRNETLVGDIDNVDAMFGKVFYVLRRLPPHILPHGFDPDNPGQGRWWNQTKMLLTNRDKESPGYGAQLVGSPTTKNIGRAGRYTGADVDEAQEVPKLNAVLQSLRGSTFHIILTGTEGTNEGEEWVDGWQSAKRDDPSSVWELNWHQNAYQNRAFLERQYARAATPDQKAKVALEYERNYFAGIGERIYPAARLIEEDDLPYRHDVDIDTTFDPGKDDELAALICQTTMRKGVPGIHVLFTWEKRIGEAGHPEWAAHVFTGIWPEKEKDACWGMEPDHEEKRIGAFYYDAWINHRPMRWFMDPTGVNSQTATSWFTMFRDKTEELRQRRIMDFRVEQIRREELGEPVYNVSLPDPFGITCQYLILNKHRLHVDRHYAAKKFLPATTIQKGIRSTRRFKTCLVRYQYNPRSPKAVTESVPLHNQYSHLASAYEYYCIYFIYGFVDPPPVTARRPGTIQPITKIPRNSIPAGFRGPRGVPRGYPRRTPGGPAPPPDRGRSTPGGWR